MLSRRQLLRPAAVAPLCAAAQTEETAESPERDGGAMTLRVRWRSQPIGEFGVAIVDLLSS